MDGSLFTYYDIEPDSFQGLAYTCDGSIICMRAQLVDGLTHLAAGTTQGTLYVFWANPEVTLAYSFLAHVPSDSFDSNFGSLVNYSEIWSLSWAPGKTDALATASEDQTVKIWNLTAQTEVTTLPKHAKAVTGVLWFVSQSSNKEQLVSCSDDMNVRLYDASTWELLRTFTTYFIREWHTLTYIGVQGPYVAVSTQIGFVVVFNLETGAIVLSRRIHTGSVEGLVWRSVLATVSSDCTVAGLLINE